MLIVAFIRKATGSVLNATLHEEAATRAGRYVRQDAGYRAFLPAPLPPNPPIKISDRLQRLLSEADIALGRLDGSIQVLPNADMFVYMYVRKEAVLSSQIEGTQSSLQDLLAEEASIASAARPPDVAEVVNYVAAMNHGLSRLKTLPVSVRLIREIHAALLRGARGAGLAPGELRTSQNWIGPAGCTINEAAFVPPPPSVVPDALGQLENFLHSKSPLPLLVRIGLAHAQFETIHPFLDGNGRVGRLLITFLLCEAGVLRKPILYLSHYLRKNRQQYYDLLQAIREKGEWENWIEFFLKGVRDVSTDAAEVARRILEMREQHRNIITQKLGRAAGNGYKVLDQLYLNPIISVNGIRKAIGTTYPAANALAERLGSAGILSEITGQSRNRLFQYMPYVRLFQQGTEPEHEP